MRFRKKPTKNYRSFDPLKGYPADDRLFYECLQCGDIIPSIPKDSCRCSCRNIMIDIDYGRISIQDNNQIKLFSLVK